ncbi:MAG: pyruvate formate lyase family protein, partial [Clostridia bacterium]|nr:pyruvate formate lyase family protein [Clostridia bacterium]
MYTSAHLESLYREMDHYYASFDPQTESWCDTIDGIMTRDPSESPYLRRAAIIDAMCRNAPVHLFRNTPFFFEMAAGRPRYSWGGCAVPFHRTTEKKWLIPYGDALAKDRELGFLHGWNNPVGLDHHCPNYDILLEKGLLGIIRDAEDRLARESDPRKQAFYQAVIASNRSLCHLAARFAEEAARLADEADDSESAAHYREIADTAARIPANPPETFREALNAILFYREVVGSVEGIGISTFAQLDRLLDPYFQADRKAGRITQEDAYTLLCELLVYTDTRFASYSEQFHETSTTIELGGCDRDGNLLYNDVTRMILDAAAETRNLNTKLNCRISKKHPREYLEHIARLQLIPLSCLMMHNDDVIIPARVRQEQAVEDARLYVGCGCHEVVLSGSEVCTRADTWISLPRILLAVLEAQDYPDFESFYTALMDAIGAYHHRIVAFKNAGEAHWAEYAPMPLYSSTFPTSLERGLDVTEGGAKYNTTALSMAGTDTLIDSIYAVKELIFEKKNLTREEYLAVLASNFENAEDLRHKILRELPKHGTNDPVMNEFSARVLDDISTCSGQTN